MRDTGVKHVSTMALVVTSSHGASVGKTTGSGVLLHIAGDAAQPPDQPKGQIVARARLTLLPGLIVLEEVR